MAPGRLQLGATLLWSVAPNYREAIAGYYQALVESGIIRRHVNSEHKTAVSAHPSILYLGITG